MLADADVRPVTCVKFRLPQPFGAHPIVKKIDQINTLFSDQIINGSLLAENGFSKQLLSR